MENVLAKLLQDGVDSILGVVTAIFVGLGRLSDSLTRRILT